MRPPKYKIKLSEQDIQKLEKFVSQGKKSAREINKARILLMSMEGIQNQEIAKILGISKQTIYAAQKKFCLNQYENILAFLKDELRSGRPREIDTRVQSNITMIACSKPPEGRAKWTLRLIADKVIELKIAEYISYEGVRTSLKKTN